MVYPVREFVDDGGLISYGADVPEAFRRLAGYVDGGPPECGRAAMSIARLWASLIGGFPRGTPWPRFRSSQRSLKLEVIYER